MKNHESLLGNAPRRKTVFTLGLIASSALFLAAPEMAGDSASKTSAVQLLDKNIHSRVSVEYLDSVVVLRRGSFLTRTTLGSENPKSPVRIQLSEDIGLIDPLIVTGNVTDMLVGRENHDLTKTYYSVDLNEQTMPRITQYRRRNSQSVSAICGTRVIGGLMSVLNESHDRLLSTTTDGQNVAGVMHAVEPEVFNPYYERVPLCSD